MEKNDPIIIICYNVVKGGGPPIVSDFLNYSLTKNIEVILLCPKNELYKAMVNEAKVKNGRISLTVKWFPGSLNLIWFKPVINYLYLPLFTLFSKGKHIYNLGNVAFPSVKKQFLLMHNAFAVCSDDNLYQRFPVKPRIVQKLMNYFIRVNLIFADVIAVQTQTIKNKIDQIIGKEALIIANMTQNHEVWPSSYRRLDNTGHIKFLLLSKYYIHKNFEILIPLAKLILKYNKPYIISVTLDEEQKDEKNFLKLVADENLTAIIKNIGYIAPDEIADTYYAHDALLLPSLLESFSGTYTEAMRFGKPIFTSDKDFSREVCGEYAFYFDPLNENDILTAFDNAFHDVEIIQKTVEINQKKLKTQSHGINPMSELIFESLSKI